MESTPNQKKTFHSWDHTLALSPVCIRVLVSERLNQVATQIHRRTGCHGHAPNMAASARLLFPHFLTTAARTYPRVLPASLPSVSEPDRNQGGSLVLPGLELLPVPEPLLNFELETKKMGDQLQALASPQHGTPG